MSQIIRHIFAFFVYLVLQIALFNHLGIGDVAVPFVFLLFLFLLPFDYPLPIVMGIAFLTGLSVDVMTESAASGLHAFACVLAVWPREQLAALVSGSNFRSVSELNFRDQSALWFAIYLGSLIFLHNLAYFFLEAMSFQGFFMTIFKILASTLYTFLLCVILSFIFYKR